MGFLGIDSYHAHFGLVGVLKGQCPNQEDRHAFLELGGFWGGFYACCCTCAAALWTQCGWEYSYMNTFFSFNHTSVICVIPLPLCLCRGVCRFKAHYLYPPSSSLSGCCIVSCKLVQHNGSLCTHLLWSSILPGCHGHVTGEIGLASYSPEFGNCYRLPGMWHHYDSNGEILLVECTH